MRARVMVHARIKPGQETAFEDAFEQVRANVRGTSGHLGDQLLRAGEEPGTYILLSEWRSREEFLAWEESPVHRQLTTPMRPYWAGAIDRRIFDVVRSTED
jgi:heme oxygenase (mycobilin-producing)